MTTRVTGAKLAREWGLSVQQALYRERGDWYHRLSKFPGALIGSRGYKVFASSEAFHGCPQLQIKKDVHVPGGIQQIPGYVSMVRDVLDRRGHSSGPARPLLEGRATEIVQTRYERDRNARAACLGVHGYSCCVCRMSFEERYGELGRGFIHVHHIEPLAFAEHEREVDPVKDLVPVCPNCHAMLHRHSPPLTPSALLELLADTVAAKLIQSPL